MSDLISQLFGGLREYQSEWAEDSTKELPKEIAEYLEKIEIIDGKFSKGVKFTKKNGKYFVIGLDSRQQSEFKVGQIIDLAKNVLTLVALVYVGSNPDIEEKNKKTLKVRITVKDEIQEIDSVDAFLAALKS